MAAAGNGDRNRGVTAVLENHGHTFFVQPWQSRLFYWVLAGSMILFCLNLKATNASFNEGRYGVLILAVLLSLAIWTIIFGISGLIG